MADATLFTYGNHTLYASDLALLQPGQWLNDRVIGFYYECAASASTLPPLVADTAVRYLEEECLHTRKAVLVNPDTAMMMLFLGAPIPCLPLR